MRPLKFRLWNGTIMYHFALGDDVMITDKPVMQFTGLTDRHGKEIYEGDIVSCADIIVAVTWKDAGFHIITNESQGASMFVQERAKHFEVIGNIYENPELL